ncbi:hypothetical protein DPMN_181476 [Dreissena polymorpha]|uniref:Cystatin domain-containing protein n=1 Tax=Dreissena polymorpha TaxID=45954 RepID=A0A9D4I3R5_DREPO|nr:hypothetical protein DPMN_181476 [Dreissena polymorpha]
MRLTNKLHVDGSTTINEPCFVKREFNASKLTTDCTKDAINRRSNMAAISCKILALTALVTMVQAASLDSFTFGGKEPMDSNDLEVDEIANFAANDIGSEYSVESVLKAQKQVVSGINYFLTIRISKFSSNQARTCDVVVVDPPGTESYSLTSFSCY